MHVLECILRERSSRVLWETTQEDTSLVNAACCGAGNGACASLASTKCDATCAVTYVPFYDKCKTLLNVLGDVHGRDTHRDGNASEFAAVYNECVVSDRCLLPCAR